MNNLSDVRVHYVPRFQQLLCGEYKVIITDINDGRSSKEKSQVVTDIFIILSLNYFPTVSDP